ncbi:helix-turn-helix domain-containing protein [Roseivirga thermotolerans]|uniref:helix-turn-helix domain-containing protein n=1 Tax=Roseivirga thermotolerans TaxID=1758176 RepID=UPI00273F8477|nr:helix-turn-helix transcriptional regulator [Roseivirga thermotolerans]
MISFGKKISALRKDLKMSQTDLAKMLNTSVSVISRYERDEMTPSIEAAKKLAALLNTTVGYLLGETEEADLFKDKKMLQRLQDIMNLPEKERESLLTTVDHFIKASKISMI